MPATPESLAVRAAFDLRCPVERLQLYELGGGARGVIGCGLRASYVERCDPTGRCSWVLDASRREAPNELVPPPGKTAPPAYPPSPYAGIASPSDAPDPQPAPTPDAGLDIGY